MHNCKITKQSLIDLVFDELQASSGPPPSTSPSGVPHCGAGDVDKNKLLLAEVEGCSACRAEYASLRRTLSVVNQTSHSVAPAESFWPGYHSRLSQRIKIAAATTPIADAVETRSGARIWSALRKIAGTSVRIPVPVAAVLVLLFGLAIFLLMPARGQSRPTPVTIATAVETRTIEVPVIKETVVTRVVYVARKRRLSPAQPGPIGAPDFSGTTASLRVEPANTAAVSLSGFRPTDQVKLTIIKGSYHDEK